MPLSCLSYNSDTDFCMQSRHSLQYNLCTVHTMEKTFIPRHGSDVSNQTLRIPIKTRTQIYKMVWKPYNWLYYYFNDNSGTFAIFYPKFWLAENSVPKYMVTAFFSPASSAYPYTHCVEHGSMIDRSSKVTVPKVTSLVKKVKNIEVTCAQDLQVTIGYIFSDLTWKESP